MPTVEFLPLDPRAINVRTFECGKEAINVYLRRYAVKNMALNLSDPKSQILFEGTGCDGHSNTMPIHSIRTENISERNSQTYDYSHSIVAGGLPEIS
ncbi:MAG: hypothetical protein OXC84_12395 [Gammaproteobacteria bacterium]|nr:hypothetical protein [Gammaproteobacteria bacterium]